MTILSKLNILMLTIINYSTLRLKLVTIIDDR